MTDITIMPMHVRCPWCAALPGEECRGPDVVPLRPSGWIHGARTRAWGAYCREVMEMGGGIDYYDDLALRWALTE